MKFTVVFAVALCVSTTWAIKTKIEEPKDKREALGGYPSSGHSSHSYQAPSLGHEGASAISVGAGYSIGGAKPGYTYGEPAGQHASQAAYQISSEGLPASGHATLQFTPLTLQSAHAGLVSNDLSQLMSQLSHGLNTGAISLPGGPESVYQIAGQGAHGQGQELAFPQFTYGAPKLQQYALSEQGHAAAPSYAAGTKGLGTYGSTGPVLFTPSESHGAALSYGGPSSGHAYLQPTLPLGDSGHSLPGVSLGGAGHSFGGSLKQISGSYLPPSKTSFKPSTFLGSSVQEEGHGLSALSGSHGAPSFGGYQSLSSGHGLSLGSGLGHGGSFGSSFAGYGSGSAKHIAPSYLPPKSEAGFGSLDSISAFSSSGHLASPPGTTYGVPTGSYSSGNAHTASSSPQYYVAKHSSPSSHSGFGHGSSSYRSPASSHSSLSSYSSGPKYSFGHSSSRYGSPKDVQGAYSETSYNTIKYSEELKPQNH